MTFESFEQKWRLIVSSIRERLRAGGQILGVFVAFPEPRLLDMWATAGFDFVIVDLEHATIGMAEADHLIQAAVRAGLAPLVRAVPEDRQFLLRCLDAGAAGIVVPDVKTVGEVEEWARAITYPPSGSRGVSQVRANDWNTAEISDDPRWRPLLVPMIESLEAIKNADQLFKSDLADWYHIGLADLGMRLRGQPGAAKPLALATSLGELAASVGGRLGYNQSASPITSAPLKGIQAIAVPDRVLALNGAKLFVKGSTP